MKVPKQAWGPEIKASARGCRDRDRARPWQPPAEVMISDPQACFGTFIKLLYVPNRSFGRVSDWHPCPRITQIKNSSFRWPGPRITQIKNSSFRWPGPRITQIKNLSECSPKIQISSLVWKWFLDPVGVFCTRLDPPNCHITQNYILPDFNDFPNGAVWPCLFSYGGLKRRALSCLVLSSPVQSSQSGWSSLVYVILFWYVL